MIKVGIENINEYLHLFENKKVGLITNPTGVDHNLKTTIDILNEKTNLIALFSPEHGIRGDLQAGVQLNDYTDPETGCIVYSLYGKNKRPTRDMLKDIDVLCFDIQDVGARFYTFIYTMAYAMMACAEYGKQFIVFDRPNPVGDEVEGNILDTNFRSFIGYYPLVQRYGLTIGELATLFNNEYEINCDLQIVKMNGYKRNMKYQDTKFPWVLPSPNIPTVEATFSYLATCIFEGTNISEGRGTTRPFSVIGSPWLDHKSLVMELDKHNLEGVMFRPLFFTPTFSKHANKLCNGIELIITDYDKFKPVITGYTLLYLIKEMHPEFAFNPPYKIGLHPMIDLNTGGDFVRLEKRTLEEIKIMIYKDSKEFRLMKERYHLYD